MLSAHRSLGRSPLHITVRSFTERAPEAATDVGPRGVRHGRNGTIVERLGEGRSIALPGEADAGQVPRPHGSVAAMLEKWRPNLQVTQEAFEL